MIAERLNRTEEAITQRVKFLKLPKRELACWSRSEDLIIRTHCRAALIELKHLLKWRTRSALAKRMVRVVVHHSFLADFLDAEEADSVEA